MNTRIKTYRSISEFQRDDPNLCRHIYQLATAIEHGCTSSGRDIPSWPTVRQWVTKSIMPDKKDPKKPGCDPLAVKNVLENYLRKPEYFNTKKGPWALSNYIARCNDTSVRVEELRWDAEKEQYERMAQSISKAGSILGGISIVIDSAKDRRIAELENELSKLKTHPEVSDAKG